MPSHFPGGLKESIVMKFRPCIDLHQGVVKQIVGSTLSDANDEAVVVNFAAAQPSSHFARLYRADGLVGGHVVMLGPGSEEAATEALAAWPGGLQVGGGITDENARLWLNRGAAAVIVTSYVFRDGRVDFDRLERMVDRVGRNRLVLDLSCRRRADQYFIVTDRWQKYTEVTVDERSLSMLSRYCFEFLVHGVDVEGLCSGVEEDLVELLALHSPIPTTYAGGIGSMDDFLKVQRLGQNRLDATVGSALDLFGGNGLRYEDLVRFNKTVES